MTASPIADMDPVDEQLDDMGSSPDQAVGNNDTMAPDCQPPVAKRKGGRKPMYTSEAERKQRNRQAQAAFRERRNEYIRQLQAENKSLHSQLSNVQAELRRKTENLQIASYKCSLLERIIRENGINIYTELAHHNHEPSIYAAQLGRGPSQSVSQPPPQQPLPNGQGRSASSRRSSTTFATNISPPPAPTAISPTTPVAPQFPNRQPIQPQLQPQIQPQMQQPMPPPIQPPMQPFSAGASAVSPHDWNPNPISAAMALMGHAQSDPGSATSDTYPYDNRSLHQMGVQKVPAPPMSAQEQRQSIAAEAGYGFDHQFQAFNSSLQFPGDVPFDFDFQTPIDMKEQQ